LLLYVSFDNLLIYSSDCSTEISNCPEGFLFSPEELFEMRLESFFSEDLMRTSSFEKLDNIWNWMNKRNTEIYMYMIFFHAYSYWSNVEFLTDSFKYFLDFILKWLSKAFSSIFCYPYYVIPAVIYCMGSFSVSHIDL